MSVISKLAEYFGRFPGIGPRQAQRFVYYLLTQNPRFHEELADLLKLLKKEVTLCIKCRRYFTKTGTAFLCSICADKNRNNKLLMVVEKDVDLDNVERGGVYNGYYFIIGGTVPILEKNPEERIRIKELVQYIQKNGFKEIILALSANPEGDHTSEYIKDALVAAKFENDVTISLLGRGLSTGTELEYSDPETIKNALQNRG